MVVSRGNKDGDGRAVDAVEGRRRTACQAAEPVMGVDGLVLFGRPGVRAGAVSVPLKPAVARLLGVLFTFHGAAVAREVLIDRLWCGRPPASARSALRTYVGQIRMATRPLAGLVDLVTVGEAYSLRVAQHASDLGRLERAIADAETDALSGRYEQVVDRLGVCVGLATRSPLEGCEDDPNAAAEIRRAYELVRTGLERYIVALVEVDRLPEALAELGAMTARNPGDERLVSLQMWALARRGRRHQAFESYETCATWLWDELGTRPGNDLEHLAQTIAAGEPTPTPAF